MAYGQAKHRLSLGRLQLRPECSRLAVERTLSGQRLTETWLETTCEQFAWEATVQAASVIAPLFQGTGSVEALHRFPGWLHLESLEFWQKALYIELAGECHDLAPMSRNSQSPTVHKRQADSISSYVVIQRQKQNANRLPIQSLKVYLPCVLITKVLENLPSLALEDAVTVEQSVGDAIQQETVSVGTTTPHRSSPRWFCERDEPSCRGCKCNPVTRR